MRHSDGILEEIFHMNRCHLGRGRAGKDRDGLIEGRGDELSKTIVCDRLTISTMEGVW